MNLKDLGSYFTGTDLDRTYRTELSKLKEHIIDTNYLDYCKENLDYHRNTKKLIQGTISNIAQLMILVHLFDTQTYADIALISGVEGFRGLMATRIFNKNSVIERSSKLLSRHNLYKTSKSLIAEAEGPVY